MEHYTNAFTTELAADITTVGQTTISVDSVSGFPTSPTFRIMIYGEIMIVTGISGTDLTVTRGAEGTTPITALTGSPVENVVTAGAIDSILTELHQVGPYASLPGTGRAGDIYIPTDSFYDMLRHNGTSWDHFRFGKKLAPPNNASFSWANQGIGSVSTSNGGIIGVTSPGTQGTLQVRYMTAPATPYTLTVGFLAHYWQFNYSQAGIGWRDSSGKLVTFGVAYNGAWLLQSQKWNSATSYSAAYSSAAMPPMLVHGPLIWLRLTNNGTNRTMQLSSNGVTWSQFRTDASNDFLDAVSTHYIHFYWGDISTYDVGITVLHWETT